MRGVRLLGALAIAMIAAAGPAFAEGPTTAGAAAAAAATATQTAAAAPAAGRASAFLRIDGPQGMVQGESTEGGHRGWIEIASFEMGVGSQGPRTGTGAGDRAGRAELSALNIVKKMDKSTAALRLAFASGTHFKDAIVELAKPSGDGHTQVYYRVTMNDVLISGDRVAGAGGGSALPTESVTLNFTKITVEYAPQKPDGTAGSYAPVREGWDVKTNVKM